MTGLNLQAQVYAQEKGETTLYHWTLVETLPLRNSPGELVSFHWP